jgi:predicted secreted hydrolase
MRRVSTPARTAAVGSHPGRLSGTARTRRVVALALGLALLASCGAPAAPAVYERVPDRPPVVPAPVTFPRDEAPHENLTEWWYYTGHLFGEDDARYGFEFVIFQVIRGDYPVVYLAHMAVTDGSRGRFWHDQRVQRGSQIGRTDGFDLDVAGWRLRGALGADALAAQADPYGLDLRLTATKPPALHDGVGWISYGPVGDSYYYSRTRLAVEGTLSDANGAHPVRGQAWMDHQWGDFLVVGGWDWYSLQLDDATELMVYVTRGPDGAEGLRLGTFVAADGTVRELDGAAFTATPTGSWTSPHTGAVYPSGWTVTVPSLELALQLDPTLLDQELETAATTGMAYWEGQVEVRGTRGEAPLSGLGYVELTGYASTHASTAAASPDATAGASAGAP